MNPFFSEIMADDANAILRELNSPTVLRMRADKNPGEHPLVLMRLSRMERMRDMLKSYAMGLIEGEPPLNTPQQAADLKAMIHRALESCLRVLECSTDSTVKTRVMAHANAMSNSISNIAHTVDSRGPIMADVAEAIREEARKAANIAADVDSIASEMKGVYDEMRVEITGIAPRSQYVPAEPSAEAESGPGR